MPSYAEFKSAVLARVLFRFWAVHFIAVMLCEKHLLKA